MVSDQGDGHLPGDGRRRLLAAGAGHSGEDDISERVHEILDREWARVPGGGRHGRTTAPTAAASDT